MAGLSRFWMSCSVAVIVALSLALAGCGSSGSAGGKKRGGGGGGYYKDDGPDANPPSNLDQIPDAVPRIEPYASGASRPYSVFGKQYVPDTSDRPYKVRGRASWYGKKFHGNSTSNGERYDMYAMTAAHTTLPLPSYVRVTSMVNGRTVVLRVNDRGPFHSDRVIDLSYVAAHKLGLIGPGSGEVVVERITHDEIRRGIAPGRPAPAPDTLPAVAAIAATPAASSHPPASAQLPDDAMAGDPILALAGIPVPAAPPPREVSAAPTPAASGSSSGPATPPTATRSTSTPTDVIWGDAPPLSASQTAAPIVGAGSVSAAASVPASWGTSPASGVLYLQLGAFSQPDNAQALARRVQSHLTGQTARASTSEIGALYRVRVGPYADAATARAAAEQIYAQTGVMPAVVAP